MLYELITFGSVFFWVILGISIFSLFFFDDNNGARPFYFCICLAIFYGLSKPPIISWEWVVSYFVVGLIWWFAIFNYKLSKLRYFLKENPDHIDSTKQKIIEDVYKKREIEYRDGSTKEESYLFSEMPGNLVRIHRDEPSLATFSDRVICWPISFIEFMFYDSVKMAYDAISSSLISYKNKFLGVS